jgi:acyl-CoA thioester hydrolase
MITCDLEIRVRYGETDRMGYAYYGYYPLYYEQGRSELLRLFGLSYRDMEDSGILLPVADMHVEYFAPAFYDELITVRTSVLKKPSVKIVFLYEIFNSKNELINKATTTLVFVDGKTRKPCRPPMHFMDAMKPHF